MKRRLGVALAAAFIVMVSLPATGAPTARTLAAVAGCGTTDNLIQNCSFESGLDSWSVSDSVNSGVVGDSDVTAYEGSYAFGGASDPGSDSATATLTQTFTPAAGTAYQLRFWHNGGDTTYSGGWLEASITLGTTTETLMHLTSYESQWYEETSTFVGTGATATLTFTYHLKTTDQWFIDAVSVLPYAATVPDAPTMTPGAAVAEYAGEIGMNWTPPGNTGGLKLRGYNLYAGTAPGEEDYTTPLNGSTLLTDTVFRAEGLTGGTTYYFAVKAVNDLGESLPSGETSAMAIDVPGAPTDLQAVAGDGSVTLSWTPPADDGGATISRYDFWVGDSATTLVYASSTSAVSAIVTGLDNGTTYWFAVSAHNTMGDGAPSVPVSVTPFRPLTAPAAPSLYLDSVGNGTIAVHWTAPADDGGSAITGYNVYVCEESGCQTRANSTPLSPTTTTFTFEGLVPDGRNYYVYVTAMNDIGESNASNEIMEMPLLRPDAPTAVTAVPQLTGRRMDVTLSWSQGAASYAVDSYTVYVYEYRTSKRNPEGTYRLLRKTFDANNQSFTISGLSAGKSYVFTVAAHNVAGWSDPSGYSTMVP